MIEKIRGVRIKGRCFKSDTNLIFYKKDDERISIIYGKNGSGKSTISEAISSINNDSSTSDLCASFIGADNNTIQPEKKSGIYVFNEKYIDENIKIDDDGLGTIVLLGDQVDLQKKIEDQENKINLLSNTVKELSNEYNKYSDKTNLLNPDYHYNRIVLTLKDRGGWADIDSNLKGNKVKSSVTPAIVKEIGELSVTETLTDLRDKYNDTNQLLLKVTDNSNSYPHSVPKVTVDPNFESQVIELLGKKVEEPVLSEREKQILEMVQRGFQEKVESVKKYFSQENTSICPYCYQPVSNQYKHSIVDSINKVLNKDVDNHKLQLNSIQYPILEIDISQYESLDSALARSIEQQLEVCNDLLSQYNDLVEKKRNNVYSPIFINSNGLICEIQKLNDILDKLESKRIEFNDAITKKESIAKELILINKSIAHIQIEQFYKDYIEQAENKTIAFQKLEKAKTKLSLEQDELKKLQDQKANISLAINNINNALDYVFLAHNRLSIELRNGKYYLKSHGADVLPKKVSLGERNIIALCYFFTQIFSNQEIGKLYQNENFIVVDDPISSFDFENKIGINSLLRFQTNQIINGNKKSKILFLSHDLETVFALNKAAEEIKKNTKEISDTDTVKYALLKLEDLKLSDFNKTRNEYGALLEKVYHFANEDCNDDALVIGNIMRRVLEAFSTFTYKKSIEMVSCDPNVKKALGDHSAFFENLMYRLVLHGESHYEEQIYSMHDDNNFYKFISDDEKIKTAKNILCFMYLLNPYHIIAYLKPADSAIDNIKVWVEDIPSNNTFETSDKSITRKIPLFYLPLSAGVGIESFEDAPYDDYETENENCDFAVKVSGDSMEPNIPDGSVVLIKKQDSIDDQVIGALYLNGKVYCKYITHENGNAYLCSYNQNYTPIKISEHDDLRVYGIVISIE